MWTEIIDTNHIPPKFMEMIERAVAQVYDPNDYTVKFFEYTINADKSKWLCNSGDRWSCIVPVQFPSNRFNLRTMELRFDLDESTDLEKQENVIVDMLNISIRGITEFSARS